MAIQSSDGKVYETDLDHQLGRPVETAEDITPAPVQDDKKLITQGAELDSYNYAAAVAAGVQPNANGHWPDTYKLPNHMTFSDESKYHSEATPGGHWEDLGNDKWKFTPSEHNLKQHSEEEMRKYFKDYEPDSELNILPKKMSATSDAWDSWAKDDWSKTWEESEEYGPGDLKDLRKDLEKRFPENEFFFIPHDNPTDKLKGLWFRRKKMREDLVS